MLAISGKGGVGKTTVSSLLCHVLAKRGYRVLAVDADPDANLGMTLGFNPELLHAITTITDERRLLKGAHSEKNANVHWSVLPIKIKDIPKEYIITKNGITLFQMGAIEEGGAGCACTENTFLGTILSSLIIQENEAVIVDMEAGLEHLGRGTGRAVDAFIVVVEPGQRSFATARAIAKLAGDLGVSHIYAVASKIHNTNEEIIQAGIGDIPVIGMIPYIAEAVQADLDGRPLFEYYPAVLRYAETILEGCMERVLQNKIL
jgi:CO dehydrogenase maturation factor